MKAAKVLWALAMAFLLCCCRGGQTETAGGGDTISLKYARNLTLIKHKGYVEAILRNPWDTTQTLNRYEIRKPLRKAAVFSAVHCALLQELGMEQCIGGVCDLGYIHLPYVQEGVNKGTIVDLGNGMEPNVERVMDLQPDALMPSPFENSGGYGRIERLGIPIIECADYMEDSPLGRAEWMKFYGLLFGCSERADSLFECVEQNYLRLKALAQKTSSRPTLLTDKPYQGTWHVPGGKSTMGIMFHDAGARYIFSSHAKSGGIPMSLEAVMEAGQEADIWIMKYTSQKPLTLKELADDNSLYERFSAFRLRRVYGCNTETSAFFEETPFHPERLLENLIDLFHPELGLNPCHNYYLLLNEK